jgi:hypothetical protein
MIEYIINKKFHNNNQISDIDFINNNKKILNK